MSRSTLLRPRQLTAFQYATSLVASESGRLPPDNWIQLLVESPLDSRRALTEREETHLRYLGACLAAMKTPSAQWMWENFRANFHDDDDLCERLDQRKSDLISGFHVLEEKTQRAETNPDNRPAQTWRAERSHTEESFREYILYVCTPGCMEKLLDEIAEGALDLEASDLDEYCTKADMELDEIAHSEIVAPGGALPPLYDPPIPFDFFGKSHSAGPRFRTRSASVFAKEMARASADVSKVGAGQNWVIQRFARMAYGASPATVDTQQRQQLRALATIGLARIRRSILDVRESDPLRANEVFSTSIRTYSLCVETLLVFGSLGYALSQILQILRVLPLPAVGSDLSYWGLTKKGLGSLRLIPANLINAIHLYEVRVGEDDPKLRTAREEFAEFCLGRIGQKKGSLTDGTMALPESLVEPDPHWRACYLYALDSLRVNPGGKGHRRVHWAMHYDPDDMVRDIAKDVYPRIEKKRDIPDDGSPRRPLVTAIWWLFQAHRLALGLGVDDEKANTTLALLMRRTTEKKTNPNQTS